MREAQAPTSFGDQSFMSPEHLGVPSATRLLNEYDHTLLNEQTFPTFSVKDSLNAASAVFKLNQDVKCLPASDPKTKTEVVSMRKISDVITTDCKSTICIPNTLHNENPNHSLAATVPLPAFNSEEYDHKTPEELCLTKEVETITDVLSSAMFKRQTKRKSTPFKVGNVKMVTLAMLQTSLSISFEDIVSKQFFLSPRKPDVLMDACLPSKLQDSSNSNSISLNPSHSGFSDPRGNDEGDIVNGFFNNLQQSNQRNECENGIFMPPIPLDIVSQPTEEEQYDVERTESILPNFPLKTDGIPSSERDKEPPNVPVDGHSLVAQESLYNPNSNICVCGMDKCQAPSDLSNGDNNAGSIFKYTVDELVGLQDGFKSHGMLRPLTSLDISRPSDPRIGILLLPIEATTHFPRTLLASVGLTQTILFDTQIDVYGFGGAVEMEHDKNW